MKDFIQGSPKISICIPTYNRSDLLEKTLVSATQQTVKPFEIIVVDNCSQDNSEEVARSFKDRGVAYYRNDRNIGFVGNWNRCIELAKGDFLVILHSDDMISPFWHEEWNKIIAKYAHDDSVGAFFSHVFTVDINDNTLMVFKLFPEKERLLKFPDNFRELWLRHMCALPASRGLILRKAVFEKTGRYNEKYGTETDIALVLKLLNNYSIVFSAKYLYAYRIHGFQTFDKEKSFKTHDKKLAVLKNNLDIFNNFYRDELREGFKTPEFYKRVALMYIAIAIFHYLTFNPRIARQYFQFTKEKIPDLFSSPKDYYLLFTILLHYLKTMFICRLRAITFYREIAKSWGRRAG